MGGCSHQEGRRRSSRSCCIRAAERCADLGWIDTLDCAAAFRIRAAWGMSLTTSADHAFIIEAGAKVSRSSRRGADAAGGERGRKSAAGRNPVRFPSRVWKGSQVSHLWLNRRSWALIVSIPSPGHYRGLASNSRHASAYKGSPAYHRRATGRRIPMGSLIVPEQEHQATHGEGKGGRNTSTTLKSRKHRTS